MEMNDALQTVTGEETQSSLKRIKSIIPHYAI